MFDSYSRYGLTNEEQETVLANLKASIDEAVRNNRAALLEVKKALNSTYSLSSNDFFLRQLVYSHGRYSRWITRGKNALTSNYVATHESEVAIAHADMNRAFNVVFDIRVVKKLIRQREIKRYENAMKTFILHAVNNALYKELK